MVQYGMCKGYNGKPCPGDKSAKPGECGDKTYLLCRVCLSEARFTELGLRPAGYVNRTPAPDKRLPRTSNLTDAMSSPLLGAGATSCVDSDAMDKSAAEYNEEMEVSESAQNDQGARPKEAPVVINELLFYVKNMLDTMEQAMFLRVCEDHFDVNTVLEAKNLIFQYNRNEHIRQTKRIGERKAETSLRDIIDVFRKNDPKVFPQFVAVDISKIPPMDFRGANMASMMCEVAKLRRELDSLKHIEATSQIIADEIGSLRRELKARDERFDEMTALFYSRSRTSTQEPQPDEPDTVHTETCDDRADVDDDAQSSGSGVRLLSPPVIERLLDRGGPAKDKSWAARAAEPQHDPTPPVQSRRNEEPFTTVGKDGKPLRQKNAANDSDAFLKPQRPQKSEVIYLSGVDPKVDADKLREEIMRRCQANVRCRKLNPKMQDPDFVTFQVFATADDASRVLDKTKWPPWIKIRPWERRNRSRAHPRLPPLPTQTRNSPQVTNTVHVNRLPVGSDGFRTPIFGTPDNWENCDYY